MSAKFQQGKQHLAAAEKQYAHLKLTLFIHLVLLTHPNYPTLYMFNFSMYIRKHIQCPIFANVSGG